MRLHVLAHHGNHEVEKTDGLDESETQNGVREELATERRVAGNTLEEGSEDKTDTDTSFNDRLVKMMVEKRENRLCAEGASKDSGELTYHHRDQ